MLRYSTVIFLVLLAAIWTAAVSPADAKLPDPNNPPQTVSNATGYDRNRINGAYDPGPQTSARYGGNAAVDTRYANNYQGFSGRLQATNYYPQGSGYSNINSANTLQGMTGRETPDLFTGKVATDFWEILTGDEGTFGERFLRAVGGAIVLPFGERALYIAGGRFLNSSPIGRYLQLASTAPQQIENRLSSVATGCPSDPNQQNTNALDSRIFNFDRWNRL